MIAVKVTAQVNAKPIAKAVDEAAFRNLGHAAATIRREAIESIIVSPEPSQVGTPPHTRRRQLKRAVRFDYSKQDQTAVIGPMRSVVGESAAAHEFGEVFRGQDFDPRPFMRPALERNLSRFADEWRGSIGE